MASRKNRKKRRSTRQTFQLEQLEKKELLDASGLFSPFESQVPTEQLTFVEASPSTDESAMDVAAETSNDVAVRQEIVFVDAGVEYQADFLSDLLSSSPGISREVIHVHSDADGLEQIADALANRTDIDAIHIVSHGDKAELRLGNTMLTTNSMRGEHADELATIQAALADDADILIYGCDLAGNDEGKQFVERFSELTGADVAASDDLTGHADLGGDWDLETIVGEIETSVVIDAGAQAEWKGVLEDSLGDLRTALTSADQLAAASESDAVS